MIWTATSRAKSRRINRQTYEGRGGTRRYCGRVRARGVLAPVRVSARVWREWGAGRQAEPRGRGGGGVARARDEDGREGAREAEAHVWVQKAPAGTLTPCRQRTADAHPLEQAHQPYSIRQPQVRRRDAPAARRLENAVDRED